MTGPTIHLVLDPLPQEQLPEPAAPWLWQGDAIGSPDVATVPTTARGLICNMTDVDPAREEEFNAWYDTEHLERLRQDAGLIVARRYRATDGAPRYLALYFLVDATVAQSTEWRDRSMTPWTSRIGAFRRAQQRWLFERQ